MRRRTMALTGLVLVAVTGVLVIERLNAEREYARSLASGMQALDDGHPNLAVESFTHALALRPSSMVAYYRRGEAFAAARQDDRAIRDLRHAHLLMPEAPEPLEALGRLADARGHSAEAATWYAQAVDRLQVADPPLLYALAVAQYRAGSPGAAREPLRRALARNPGLAEAHHLLGLVLRDTQEPDEAAASLAQAVRLAPTLVAAREELVDLFRARGQISDELLHLRALSTLDPGVDRYVALAMASLRAGRHDDGLAAIAQAEVSEPNDSRVALALGRVYLADAERTGDRVSVTRALAALERALGGTARRSEGLALYGRALHLSGDLAGAERLLKDAISTSPVATEAFRFLADVAEASAHLVTARDALVRLDVLEGDTVPGSVRHARARRIGALSLAAGDARLGADYLTTAVKFGVTDAGTYGLLARARWQIGDRIGARNALDQALALNPDSAELRRLARTLK